mmetsp:Transcript_6496/g.19210  ORF Transcript_6496/g.19210 Transcript_6496/m.19210 type:complete len:380 (+) Transcript_6496:762-1901(+)
MAKKFHGLARRDGRVSQVLVIFLHSVHVVLPFRRLQRAQLNRGVSEPRGNVHLVGQHVAGCCHPMGVQKGGTAYRRQPLPVEPLPVRDVPLELIRDLIGPSGQGYRLFYSLVVSEKQHLCPLRLLRRGRLLDPLLVLLRRFLHIFRRHHHLVLQRIRQETKLNHLRVCRGRLLLYAHRNRVLYGDGLQLGLHGDSRVELDVQSLVQDAKDVVVLVIMQEAREKVEGLLAEPDRCPRVPELARHRVVIYVLLRPQLPQLVELLHSPWNSELLYQAAVRVEKVFELHRLLQIDQIQETVYENRIQQALQVLPVNVDEPGDELVELLVAHRVVPHPVHALRKQLAHNQVLEVVVLKHLLRGNNIDALLRRQVLQEGLLRVKA